MTDLDTLRRALRVRQDLGPDSPPSLDLGEIMVRGKRLRLRRRLAAAGGAVCAAAVVFGTVSGIGHLTRSAPVPGQHPVGSTRTVHPPSPRQTHVSTPVPVPSPSGSSMPTPSVSATPTPSVSATPSPGGGIASPAPTPSGAASAPLPTPSQRR